MGKGTRCFKRVCLKKWGSYGDYMGGLDGYTMSEDRYHTDFSIFPNLIALNIIFLPFHY